MNLKNYTSTVSVISSINKIEHRLAQAGAIYITKSYDEDRPGRPIGIIFQIKVNDIPILFKIPAKADKVFDYFKKQRKRVPTKIQLEGIRKQSDQTAWKILADWIDIQVSLIEIDQVEIIEIFLPYYYSGKEDKTLFEIYKNNSYQKLLSE